MFPAALLGRLVVDSVLPAERRDAGRHRPAAARTHREAGRGAAQECRSATTTTVVKLIVSRCTELESGGRMIDAILTNTVLPEISAAMLERMVEGAAVASVQVGVAGGEFSYAYA